ncbi:hypothetical protein ACWGJX_43370 [Streptomyces sp. NPDC054775]
MLTEFQIGFPGAELSQTRRPRTGPAGQRRPAVGSRFWAECGFGTVPALQHHAEGVEDSIYGKRGVDRPGQVVT